MDPLSERLKNMTPLQRAVFALKETQGRLDALERRRSEPIAIVGMACRFPGGATDPAAFWQLLANGVDAISEIPADRWNVDEFYDPDPAAPGKMATRWGGFLTGIDEFDNHFFAISDAEAARMDPQQRLLLELAWEALEDAGLAPAKLHGTKIGVFIGISVSDYGLMLSSDLSQSNAHVAAGTSLCLAANRLSFAFGFQGPSMALDTACSSSLVALHLACQHIRNGECEGALVGGANLLLSPIGAINLTKAGFCASDGRVRAFDAAATGYVRSEGAGIVMLKPLSAALKNQDPIYALIRGSAINQNGASNGLTAPSRAAQEQVLREAYQRSQVSPGEVDYVETQGTGTRLGDVIEATALGNVLRQDRPPGSRCALGAVKTNIGHLEAASGIASLMKAALALQHRELPPNLHFRKPNPDIPFDSLPLAVQRTLEPWPESAHPHFAGVSAFGFGGSNSHVVLEEPPARSTETAAVAASGPRLLPLSARTDRALHDLAQRYVDFLAGAPHHWADVCHTAAARRQHHDCRLAVLADSPDQATAMLKSVLSGQSPPDVFAGRKPFGRGLKTAFVYGSHAESWKPLVAGLAQSAAGFAAAGEEIDAACQRVLGWSLAGVQNDDARWNDPHWARSALVAVQLALTAWWRRLGITPDMVLGHGVGELAAASVAGILTTEDVLRLVAGSRGNGTPPNVALRPRAASLPFLSTVDGKLHSGTDLDASHWQSCIDSSDRINPAVAALADRQIDFCLEIGPSLAGEPVGGLLAKTCPTGVVLPSLLPANDGGLNGLTAVGTLYAAGADLLWERLGAENERCVRIPMYPWQRQRLWAPGKIRLTPAASQAPAPGETSPGQSPPALPTPAIETRRRPDLTAPYVAPRTKLEEAMIQSWATILRIDGIGIHDNFFELGGDSLQAIILLNHLQEQLGEAVPGHALFQVQSVHDLADYLRHNCPDAVLRKYPDEAVNGSSPPAMSAANGETATVTAGGGVSIPRLARDRQADDLLARLDELGDDEVESLLGKAIAEGEVSR